MICASPGRFLCLVAAAALAAAPPASAQDLPPIDPIVQIVPDNAPTDSLALQQPFLLKVRIPVLSGPDDTVTIKVKSLRDETTLTLHRIASSDPDYVEFGYGAYITFGGKRGGNGFSGTIEDLDFSNGEYVSFELSGFGAPVTAGLPVYDNEIQQGIARNNDTLRTLSDHIIQQKALVDRAVAAGPSDPEVADALRSAQWTIDVKLDALTEIRGMLEHEDTPKGKLLIGNRLLSALINTLNGFGAVGAGFNTPLDPRAQWRDATANARREADGVGADLLVSSIAAMAKALYQTTVTLSGADGLWKAVEGTDAWGKQVTTSQRVFGAFEFGGQIVAVIGLPKLIDFLADSGHRPIELNRPGVGRPTTGSSAGSPPGAGAPRVGSTTPPRTATTPPGATDPTVRLPGTGNPDAAPTVRIPRPTADPATAPTVRTGTGATDPTVRTGTGATDPTVRTPPPTPATIPDATPTVRIPPPTADPATAPTVRTGTGATDPTVRTGTGATDPTVRTPSPTPATNPDATPTVRIPPPTADPATAPTVRTGTGAMDPTVRTDTGATDPTVNTPPPGRSPADSGAATVREAAPPKPDTERPATGDEAANPRLKEISKEEAEALIREEHAEMLDEYNEALDAARGAGVPPERIREITAGAEPGDPDITYKLLKARLETEGYDLRPLPPPKTIASDELNRIRALTVRIRRGNITEDDWRWVRERLSEDPAYFDQVAKRAFTNETAEGLPRQADEAVIFLGEDAKLLKDFFGNGTPRPTTGGTPSGGPPATGAGATAPKPGEKTEILPPPDLPAPATGRSATGGPPGAAGPPTSTGGGPGGGAAVTSGAGTATNALLPSISFMMDPYGAPPDQTFVGPGDQTEISSDPSTWETFPLFAGPEGMPVHPWDYYGEDYYGGNYYGGEVLAGNDPAVAAAPADPTTQRMISVVEDLQKIVVLAGISAPKGIPVIARAARSLWNLLTGAASAARPRALASGTMGYGPGEVWLEPLYSSGTAGPQKASGTPAIRAFVTSLGTSTGEAFEVHIVNDTGRPVRVGGGSLVLEPIAREAQTRLQQQVQQLAGNRNVATVKMTAYCLEFLRQPPSRGMMFRIASRDLQQRFAPMRSLLAAAKKLQQAGLLKPDSDPTAYFHAIRQWSIWTKEQRFDLRAFGRAFVERTKQNLEELGQQWTSEIESAVLARVPGRWEDIQRVVREAAEIERSVIVR